MVHNKCNTDRGSDPDKISGGHWCQQGDSDEVAPFKDYFVISDLMEMPIGANGLTVIHV